MKCRDLPGVFNLVFDQFHMQRNYWNYFPQRIAAQSVRVGQQCGYVVVVTSSDEYHDRITIKPIDLRAKAACRGTNDRQVSTNVPGFTEMPAYDGLFHCNLGGYITYKMNTIHTLEHVPAIGIKRPE